MTIKRNLDSLPRRSPPTANTPVSDTLLMHQLAQAWYDKAMAEREPRSRAIEDLPLRASELSVRCDRQYFYKLTEADESNPNDASNIWRFHLGQVVHDDIDAAILTGPLAYANGNGWKVEENVDLRPAGIPGSAHGDAVHFTDDVADIVGEFKSVPGFTFKSTSTNFKGPPEGPKWEHIMQAAFTAVALNVERILVGYVSLENISPKVARSLGLDQFGKFTSEWQYDTVDWVDAVTLEAARQNRLLRTAQRNERPARTLSTPNIPAGAFVDDPKRGDWLLTDANGDLKRTGTTWMCDYCNFRDLCLDDGASSVITETNVTI